MEERIKELRKKLGLSQADFGSEIGVKQTTIAGYETGTRTPIDAVIISICRKFHVSYDWLIAGEGEMFESLPDGLVDELALEYQLDDMDKKMIQAYINLTVEERAAVKKYMKVAFGQ